MIYAFGTLTGWHYDILFEVICVNYFFVYFIATVENIVSNCRIHFSFSLSSGQGW